jgi:plastocyanin
MMRIQDLLIFVFVFISSAAFAADVDIEVTDINGQPIKDAVVYVEGEKIEKVPPLKKVDIAQKGKKFIPLVSAVQTGTSVSFPNNDSVRHHVYSFSPIKKFELKLYSGVPASPVIFDKAGTAVLGCNIHDSMIAYVLVLDSPYFAKTDDAGIAHLTQLPEGKHQLKVWHYALKTENVPYEQALQLPDTKKLVVKIDVNPSLLLK